MISLGIFKEANVGFRCERKPKKCLNADQNTKHRVLGKTSAHCADQKIFWGFSVTISAKTIKKIDLERRADLEYINCYQL